VTMEKKGK